LSSIHVADASLSDRIETSARLLGTAPATASLQTLPRLGAFGFVYVYVGAPERYLEVYEDSIRLGFQAGLGAGVEWAASYASVRKTEQFKAYVRDAGFVDYWKQRGWPDLCHPTTGDDFVCE
jgi:hypothetical protein